MLIATGLGPAGGATRWEAVAATDVGRKRDHNEDVFLLRPDLGLLAVCDGMGGHLAGEVAAEIASHTLEDFFEGFRRDPEGTWPDQPRPGQDEHAAKLTVAMRLANRRIRSAAEVDPQVQGMGTTCVAAYLADDEAYIGWTGDSRAYLYRSGWLGPLSADHSLVADLVRSGRMTPEEAERDSRRNVITRALGPTEVVLPDTLHVPTLPGDVLLLCSDGLHGMVPDQRMAAILGSQPSLSLDCEALIAAANANAGLDNITVILARRLG